MPLRITKKGNKYCVVDPAGKQFGCHPTKNRAVDQIAAIEISKHKRGASMTEENKSGAEQLIAQRIRVLANDLNRSFGLEASAPPIAIISDGTAEGTILLLNGQVTPFTNMDFYCNAGSPKTECDPYGSCASCSMSITLREKGEDGSEVNRTITLRKHNDVKAALTQLTKKKDK